MSLFLPCLLQRWADSSADGGRRLSQASWDDVRADVRRNLEWLLNAEAPQSRDGRALPEALRASVWCFGVPAYAGRAQSTLSPEHMADEIHQRIVWFEPRLQADQLSVRPLPTEPPHHFNTLRFLVSGYLRAHPLLPFEVRTEIDTETGQARLLV